VERAAREAEVPSWVSGHTPRGLTGCSCFLLPLCSSTLVPTTMWAPTRAYGPDRPTWTYW
jgi:hypothetical protein